MLYGAVTDVRNTLYDQGILKSHRFNIPVIVVGNLSVGGTGKSPQIEYLIRLLKNDYKVAVLSRGYKRKTTGFIEVLSSSIAEEVGDEPLQFKHKFPETTVAVCANRREGIEKLKVQKPDVVLLDINMPGKNGIDTCKEMLKIAPDTKIVAISMHKESSLIKLMLKNGAKGYVLKNAGQNEIIDAIKDVYSGKTYLDETVNEIIINSVSKNSNQKTQSPFPSLSRREKEILSLILEEFTTQEIAEKLFISFGTVETHRRNMLIKTGARNTAGLVRIAIEYELHK